jgi:hypothetical protein
MTSVVLSVGITVSNASASPVYNSVVTTGSASSISTLKTVGVGSGLAGALLHPQTETHIIAASRKIVKTFCIVLPLYCP